MRFPIALFLLLQLLFASRVWAQDNYAAFELRRAENWDPVEFHDVNGDDRKDIIVSAYSPELGRELHIFHQQPDGSFAATPQRIEIKTEIIALGFADLRKIPGKELVLFANSGVFSLSTNIEGYAGNLALLAEWDLIAAIPDQKKVQFTNIPQDIDGDGNIDLLLAGNDRYGLFLGKGEEKFELALTLTTLNEGITPIQRARSDIDLDANLGINAERGVIVELNLEAPTPFEGFIEVWDQESTLENALLRSDQWMPAPSLAHMNEDPLLDIVYLNAGENGQGRVNIHFQQSPGVFAAAADWIGDLDSRGDLNLVDMNSDGLIDILRLSGDGDNWEARFFLNKDGAFTFDSPEQVMRFSGYDMDVRVVALDERQSALSVSFYTVPVLDAIRNASINRTQLLFSRDDSLVFKRRPDSRLEESFSAENVRGLSEQISLIHDVDGDGRNDALYITDNGTLAAKSIDSTLQIATDPFWEYVSPKTVFEFDVLQLNADESPDLLLRHGTATTILVATP